MSKRNPSNSAVFQALLDFYDEIKDDDVVNATKLKDVIDASRLSLKSNLENADKKFKEHQYPLSRLVYAKVSNANTTDVIARLTSDARSMLLICLSVMSPHNLVELKKDTICDVFGIKKYLFGDVVQELVDNGIISLYFKRNKEHGNIYMLHPDYASVGRNFLKDRYEKATSEDCLDTFADTKENKIFKVAHHSFDIDDVKYIYNSVCKE